MTPDQSTAAKLREHPVPGVLQAKSLPRPRDPGKLLGHSESRQDAVHLIVKVDRPWLGVDLSPSIQYQHLDPVRREQSGSGYTGRSGTDDDNRKDPAHA
jgi:hypothetical protein